MPVIFSYAVLIGYVFCIYIVGSIIVRYFFNFYESLVYQIISSVLVGLLTVVPVTYLASCIFVYTHDGLLWGVISTTGVLLLAYGTLLVTSWKKWRLYNHHKLIINDIILLIVSLLIGFWLMEKSLFVGGGGAWYVSSNTVFDTSHVLAIIRSFSWGNNIPFASPFAFGVQESYHFFFYFFVACFERFGLSIVTSVTAISAIGFSLYLIMSYYFGYCLLGKKKIVGWLTVILLLFHSTMTWWFFLIQNFRGIHTIQTIWHLATYPFAGPYDGSLISLFFTLNVFVNQRHLAIGVAFGIWIFLNSVFVLRHKKVNPSVLLLLGGLIGLSILWNIILSFVFLFITALLFVGRKKWKQVAYICLGFCIVGSIPLVPYVRILWQMIGAQMSPVVSGYGVQNINILEQVRYWLLNLGVATVVFVVGLMTLKKKERNIISPILSLFIAIAIGTGLGNTTISQKILNFWNIAFVAVVASGVVWIWQKKGVVRFIVVPILFSLTASGFIDSMVIKNDFAYPATTQNINQFIGILHQILPEDAVVLSYKEMFHPVSLAGRKQYYGFFASPQADYRKTIVKQIVESSTEDELIRNIKHVQITHILLPKQPVNDFSYKVHFDLYRSLFITVYEDDKYILFDVRNRVIQ